MQRTTFFLRFVTGSLLIPVLISLLLVASPASAAPPRQTGVLSGRLALLADSEPLALSSADGAAGMAARLSLAASGPGSLSIDRTGRILVHVRLSGAGAMDIAPLTSAGAEVVHLSTRYGVATAFVPVDGLNDLAGATGVTSVREALRPFRRSARPSDVAEGQGLWWCTGQVVAESAALVKADRARQTYGVNGEGVTVGILSDSYNVDDSVTTAELDVLTGDLPGDGNACGWFDPVIVRREGFGDGWDEGRAMAQIVHDIAPAARLVFTSASYGIFDYAEQIRGLAAADGCDVIVDDIGYFIQPLFQDGPVSVAVDEVTAQRVFYYSAAGNATDTDPAGNVISSYRADAFRPIGYTFTAGTDSGQMTYDTVHDFDPGPGQDPTMNFILEPGGGFYLMLGWAEPWYGVDTDLDLYVLDDQGRVLASSADTNTGSIAMPWPAEVLYHRNDSGSNQTVAVVIARATGTGVPAVQYIMPGSWGILFAEYNSANSSDTFGPSAWGHPSAQGATALAAVPYNNVTSPESFTSMGNMIYTLGPVNGQTPAQPLAAPETRVKPEAAAPDGVATTFFIELIDGVYRFYGTSAAAPAAAGVGALMKSQAGARGVNLSPARARAILQATATPVAGGSAEITGAGLIDAEAALAAIVNTDAQQAFTTRMFRQALNRDPTTAELDSWTAGFTAGTAFGEALAREVFLGAEMTARGLSNRDFAAQAFRALIGWDASDGVLNYYTAQLDAGRTRADFLDELITSDEFAKVCATYDVTPYA